MQYTLIIPSNRPGKFKRFSTTINILGTLAHQVRIHLSVQRPWTIDLANEYLHSGIIDSFSYHPPACPMEMVKWRRSGIEQHPDSDFYWFLDDDHQFADSKSTGLFTKTCHEYYSDVFEYLKENKDVGVLSCRGYFGGYAWEYDFRKNPTNALIATSHGGLFIRNIGVEKICPESIRNNVGALYESVFGYNVMSEGYKFAKRYNSPTRTDAVKHIGDENISYSHDVVSKNNQAYIRNKFNDLTWTHSSKRYPKGLPL